MIDLVYHSENAFIYNADDWAKLRKEFRCIGKLFGRTQTQEVLPLQLQPEEALLLIEKQVGRLVSYGEAEITKEELVQFQKRLFEAQQPIYKERRLIQLNQYADRIVAGKRKKGDTRSEKEIIDGELAKFKLEKRKMVWPLFRERFDKDSPTLIDKEVLFKLTTATKYEIFKNLWEQNYYLTRGWNFGGDFLVYPGDPMLHHSHFIVRCLEENEKLHPSELVALGRLATSVRKKGVLSYIHNGTVHYITIKWIGK